MTRLGHSISKNFSWSRCFEFVFACRPRFGATPSLPSSAGIKVEAVRFRPGLRTFEQFRKAARLPSLFCERRVNHEELVIPEQAGDARHEDRAQEPSRDDLGPQVVLDQ